MDKKNFRNKDFILALLSGFFFTVFTGLIRNSPGIGVPEIKYYGYPLPWRRTTTFQIQRIVLTNFFVDLLFWITVFGILIFLVNNFNFSINNLMKLIILIVLCGFFMDLVHEFGHLIWGSVLGGKFETYKKPFIELLPHIRVVEVFE